MCKWIIQDYSIINKGESVRLSATLYEGNFKKELWFSIPTLAADSLLDYCLDAFLVAVLPVAMMSGCDIKVAGRVSEKLYNSVVDSVIPLMSGNVETYNAITITADEIVSFPCTTGHIGTGLSCGVDSFYTVLSLMKEDSLSKLDTLAFFNVGSHRSTSGFTDEESRELFSVRLRKSKECAKELGLPLLVVDSNIGQYLHDHQVPFVQVHAFCSASAVLACGSYFNRYYYSSADFVKDYDLKRANKSTSSIELTLLPWLSTEYTELLSYGFTKTRLQKVRAIADSPVVQKHLDVCWREASNCGKCPKCVRTLMELHVIGKIDQFKGAFDVKGFYSHFAEHKKSIYNKSDDRFNKEIIYELKKLPAQEYTPSSFLKKKLLGIFKNDKQGMEIETEERPNKTGKAYLYLIDNAGDLFNQTLLEFFAADMEGVDISAHADLLMLGGMLSSLQNPDKPIDGVPLYVWGTGFICGDENHYKLFKPNLIVKALRGKLSKDKLSDLLGKSLPDNLPLADPGLLASYFTSPNIEKEFAMGFIPHFREHGTDEVSRVLSSNPGIHFIDITRSPKDVIKEIQRCDTIVSSSLHGLVFADSICIPNVHTRLTELPRGGSFKFRDYYSAFGLKDPALTVDDVCGIRSEEIKNNYAIERRMVEEKKRQLIESFPKHFCR